jgi:hypothetical protein
MKNEEMEINAFEAYSVEKLMKEMEKMAGKPEERHIRQPGERCKYEDNPAAGEHKDYPN